MAEKNRLLFIDNIRILLIILVVAHHVGQAYGSTGGWWAYQEPERARYLGLFFIVNRSFFMSLFFMISGYFMPASFDRKGPGVFLKERLLRFGIPLLFFLLLVIPVEHYAYFLSFRNYGDIPFPDYYRNYYFGLGDKPADWSGPAWPEMNFGHLWFIEHLLVFALGYAVLRTIRKRLPAVALRNGPPGHIAIILLTLGIAVMSFTVRIWYPIDRWIGLLGFIQVAFADVPRDLSWFIVGVIAYRCNWLETIPARTGLVWLCIGIVMAMLCYVLWPLRMFPREIYPLWESLLCSGMCIGLTVLFRERFNYRNMLAKTLADTTYAAYLFHVPVVVVLQYAAGGLTISPFMKFLLVTVLALPLAFTLGYCLRKVPLVKTIL